MNGARIPRTRYKPVMGLFVGLFVGLFGCGIMFYVLILLIFAALNSF